jgi:hypothetical protein
VRDGESIDHREERRRPGHSLASRTATSVARDWWSERLAAELESGVRLKHDGFGHNYSSTCIDDAVVSYLLDLKVPRAGTVCTGLP